MTTENNSVLIVMIFSQSLPLQLLTLNWFDQIESYTKQIANQHIKAIVLIFKPFFKFIRHMIS